MRRVAKTDSNHVEISDALRSVGCTVQSLHQVGGGVPDLLVGAGGLNFLFEVKTPQGRFTPDEKAWLDEWRGQAFVVRTSFEAIQALQDSLRTKEAKAAIYNELCRLAGYSPDDLIPSAILVRALRTSSTQGA